MTTIALAPLTRQAFAPFGDVLDCDGTADKMINQGLCGRWHDRAALDFEKGANAPKALIEGPTSLR